MAKEFVETTLLDGFADGPHITVEQVGSANQGLYGPGDYVMDAGRNAEAQILTNNSIRVFDAVFVIQGRRDVIAANDYEDINIDNGAQGMNRNDIIVRRYTKDESSEIERTEYAVIKGTPTPSTATDPEVTVGNVRNGDTLHEMKLYRVKLEGLNIVAIEPLFQVLMNMNKINKCLSDNCIGFPDYTKVLGEYSNKSFAAPENCWARIISTSGWTNTTLNVNGNGVVIQQIQNTDSYPIRTSTMIPLKKGDVVTMSSPTKVNGITVLLYPMRR